MVKPQLKRKSFFVDERTLHRAKRLLRASSDAEAIRLSLERVAEMVTPEISCAGRTIGAELTGFG